jgi:putative heme iron utilization protein
MDEPIAAYLEAEGKGLVVRFNDEFGDAGLFVARTLGGFPAATAARITAIDPEGIDAVVDTPEGEVESRLEFGVEVVVPDHLTMALVDLLERAREASGEEGQTSAEREMTQLADIGTH